MITFACEGCGRSFTVPDAFAGRKANCKTCGASVSVPVAAAPAAAVAQGERLPLRIRRLRADALQMSSAFIDFPLIQVRSGGGDPPDSYEVEYRVCGLERGKNDQPIVREHHMAEIRLPAEYPRLAPKCRMITPIFHPNIDASSICVGDHWTAGERLADLVIRIGEMIAYQAYNIKSPLNAEAAMWADLHAAELPVDSRNLRPAES
jgi:ubiquitin-protein ligase